MKNPFRRLHERLAYYRAAVVDSIIGDDPDPTYSRMDRMDVRGTVDLTGEPTAVRDVTPIYDGLVAEKLAGQRAVMAPLLSTEELALLAHDGKVDAELYEDMLDVLCARAMGADFWAILDAEAQSIGGESDV